MVTSTILGADGRPFQLDQLDEPQTSRLANLHREFQNHPSRGLTPSRLASILDAAEQGDTVAQYELFEDMEEKDPHIASEMGKRRRAVILDYEILPPPNATPAEKDAAKQVEELLTGIPDLQEIIFDTTDAIGKAFACQEIAWHQLGGQWLPASITHRPQTWFKLHRGYTQEIRLRNGAQGDPLQPFGWITHTHRAKSGYLERAALFRVLVWPFLFKNYSVGDLAEFLEIYGIPLRIGTYPPGASDAEKATLLRALIGVSHNAAGIIPEGMKLDFHEAATGDPAAFELMISWCERSQSKAILGGTLTSQADGKSSTNALGNVHNEVRKDLRDSDCRQVDATLTRDLVYPIAALNGLAPGGIQRAPRLRLSVDEPEDIQRYAESMPKLVGMGFRIGRQWAQERVGIPEPDEGEDVLTMAPAVPESLPAVAALSARQDREDDTPAQMAGRAARGQDEPVTAWIDQVRDLVERATSLQEVRDGLDELYPGLTLPQYAERMAQALAAAALAGRYEIVLEAANGDR
ncbi:Mu-like prophage FluMu protein gp29 [plant metagenome]|uniref:Mu-like prophage FluMu protein gp29 n=1 Tax=plant metagenome TaxID=1297885 RepID=A0A484Q8S4_9ZZZZ